MKMKKVLMIAYHFPPVGGPSVQRTSKFVKYLPSYGWQPVILTVKNPDADYFDPILLNDIPSKIVVRRTFSLNLWRYYRVAKYGKKSLYETNNGGKQMDGILTRFFGRIRRLVSKFINTFLLIPDDYNNWIPFALWSGFVLIRRERISLIYATGNPWTSFIIAKWLSAATNIPYVIDFRDPWILSPYITRDERHTVKHRILRMIEYSCIKKASCVINVNENITAIFKKYYHEIESSKFKTITHGFDKEDFSEARLTKNNKFVIAHIGTFYYHRKPDNLFKAVDYIFKTHPYLREKIEIRFIGITGSFAEASMRRSGLTDVVKFIPYIPHKESVKEMCAADLLVLIQAGFKGKRAETSPGKVYEYLASGTKILALMSKRNEAVRIIEDLNAGVAVEPENIDMIATVIMDCYRNWEMGRVSKRQPYGIDKYCRKYLAGVLATNFDDIYKNGQL